MTRRDLFAAIAAAFAGRKALPAAAPAPGPFTNASDYFLECMLPAMDEMIFKKYSVAQYGVGVKVRLELAENDARLLRAWRRSPWKCRRDLLSRSE